jgi:hypothetical protein
MKLSPAMQHALTRINTALIEGHDEALVNALESVPLEQLLSEDNIACVRARGKKSLVLLLSSLAVSNDVGPARAQLWLDCYQSIANKSLTTNMSRLSEHNILRIVLTSLVHETPLLPKDLVKFKGDHQHWWDAFELAVDNKAWSTAVAALEALGKKKVETILWLQLAKRLSKRHALFMDESGIPFTDVDYLRLSRLYELCINAAKNANAMELVAALAHLRARCLEMGGHYAQSIALLKQYSQGKQAVPAKMSIARNHCRMGDLPASIRALDSALEEFNHLGADRDDSTDLQAAIGPARPPDSSFNIAAASKALSDLAVIFNEIDLKFFLVSGTLLGYEREGKFLDHDKDIDIGVVGWEKQYDICLALQKSNKFTISAHFLKGQSSHYIPIQHNPTGSWIDIFIYFDQGDKWVTGVDFFFGYRQTFAFTPFELKPINFLGVDMYVPGNTDLNLTENFGNWRVPDASYISHLESPSTMNKGGLEHLLTARLTALGALIQRKPKKLRKLVDILRLHANQPCAMPEPLLESLLAIAANFEKNQNKGTDMEAALIEVIHA